MTKRIEGIVLGLAILLGSCNSASVSESTSDVPEVSPTTVSEAESTTTANAEPASAGTTTLANSPVEVSSAYPEIGALISAESGDLMCYATVRDRQGQEFQIGATYEVCDRQNELLNQTVRLVYSEENVADCQSAEPCGRTRRETLISDVVILGENWQVLSNGEWTVTVGSIDSWSGVNNTGSMTYYGCDADGSCLALDGGFAVCRNGVCNWSWENGDYAYTISSELNETGDGPTTLLVWQGSTEILRAENMEVVDSSDF